VNKQTPQSIAAGIVETWANPGGSTTLHLYDMAEPIAAAIQAERDRHAAEVARAQDQTNCGARLIAFHQAAQAVCSDCGAGDTPRRDTVSDMYCHHSNYGGWLCRAHGIHVLIAAEEAANVSA
jgi:hypothetical protein